MKGALKKKLIISIFLNITITIVEIIGGLFSGSISLLSDSIHNLGDSMSLTASYGAIKIGEREKNKRYTFGYKRAGILVALGNSAVLFFVSIFLIYESFVRLFHPSTIHGLLMLVIAIVGLTGNVASVFLLHAHSKESINVKSAYLHLLSDTLSSIAVVFGALLIIFSDLTWVDPLISILIALYIIYESFSILKESVSILMESSPNLDFENIKREIEKIEGVRNAHHFHAWQIGEGEIAMECHVETENMPLRDAELIIDKIENIGKNYGITHVTVQLETERCENKEIVCKEN